MVSQPIPSRSILHAHFLWLRPSPLPHLHCVLQWPLCLSIHQWPKYSYLKLWRWMRARLNVLTRGRRYHCERHGRNHSFHFEEWSRIRNRPWRFADYQGLRTGRRCRKRCSKARPGSPCIMCAMDKTTISRCMGQLVLCVSHSHHRRGSYFSAKFCRVDELCFLIWCGLEIWNELCHTLFLSFSGPLHGLKRKAKSATLRAGTRLCTMS